MEFWTRNIDAVWELSKAYQRGGLTLFLGAGVSRGCGLPLWPQLVDDLYTETCRYNYYSADGLYGSFDAPKGYGGLQKVRSGLVAKTLTRLPLPIQSRFCKSKLGKNYEKVLQKTLYKKQYTISITVKSILELKKLKIFSSYVFPPMLFR